MEKLTYLLGPVEYPTLEVAKGAASQRVVKWEPKFYDACQWHGDSLVGIDSDGYRVCEIKFLSDGRFCAAHLHDETCLYGGERRQP